jgi:microcystin-dependent protein
MLQLINKPKGVCSLAADLDSSAIVLDVYSGQEDNLPQSFPFRLTFDYEVVEVTSAVGVVGSIYRYNVTRAVETDLGAPDASAHGKDTVGELRVTAGTVKQIQDAITNAPPGAITMYSAGVAPAGWLLCDGSAVSRSAYGTLFSLIGTTYGVGNGTTTFNLPNLKGRIPVGFDTTQTEFNTLGETGGEKTHTLTTAEMPSHVHTQSGHFTYTIVDSGAGPNNVGAQQTVNTGATGGDGAHNNLQPYIALNYIIKI